MTRIAYLLCAAVAIISGICLALQIASAKAAVHIDRQDLNTRPEKAKDADQTPKATCLKQAAVILYHAVPGGQMEPIAIIRGPLEPC